RPSVNVNIPSYLRLSLINLVADYRQGKDLRNELNARNSEIMRELTEVYKCSNINDTLSKVSRHIDTVAKALEGLGYVTLINTNVVLLTRLAIGFNNPYTEPLEPAISWDPYWNLPYIPASSLKGAMRSVAHNNKSQCLNAFGAQDESSSIIILDAYPVYCPQGKSLLTLDILNPHYRETEGEVSEVQSRPTPLPFLTISRGVGLKVVVMVARSRIRERLKGKCSDKDISNYVYAKANCKEACTGEEFRKIIIEALQSGIGAKTALGYGIFNIQEK
ncbi:type III-B CRISPR module RAMP protein Cmr6, partial [Caldivirga sp. UBA161]|uniref:type III-B CRISPR module RAMP protein Cmr6 n=1 Tax=Caldivirga sp. UBA161 TaxID=1915569 RepID=UPI0025C3259E